MNYNSFTNLNLGEFFKNSHSTNHNIEGQSYAIQKQVIFGIRNITMSIEFNFPEKVSLANRTILKDFILSIFKKEKKKAGNISYVFCSDDYLLDINRSYLNHDYFTDIITFDLSESGSNSIDGEIYISVDTVRDNARRFKTSFSKELHRVMFHGVLHLCGYKDKSDNEQTAMTEKEDHYLHLYSKMFHVKS